MNGPIAWFARNPIAANLLMIGIIIAGLLSLGSINREFQPTLGFNGMSVSVGWPGASPLEVEQQIITRIEEAISDVDNIQSVSSSSREGGGSINIRADDRTNMIKFKDEIQTRVDGVSGLPRDIEPPRVIQWVNRQPVIRIALSGNLSEIDLKILSEDLRREMATLNGVTLVRTAGSRLEEVSIEVSENALRRYNISFATVADAIRSTSINRSSGRVQTDVGAYSLRVRNQAKNQVDFENIVIRQTADGGVLKVSDVAIVKDGFVETENLTLIDGAPLILLEVLSGENIDVVTASDSVKAWIETRKPELQAIYGDIDLAIWFSEAEILENRLETIGNSAFYGLILVLVLLLLTLRPIVAFWVTIGIATAYAGAFIFLPASGVTLNMLSTFAFLMVLGIVVDDAIVVGENIHSESHKHEDSVKAAIVGTQLVAKPVIYAVLTTIIAFLPWVFLTGAVSEITRHITMVVVFALLFSLIESLLILPAHLAKLRPRSSKGIFTRIQQRIANSISNFAEKRYRPIGQWTIRHRYSVFFGFFMFILIGFIGLLGNNYVKTNFVPDVESPAVGISVTMPSGNTFERTKQVLAQVEAARDTVISDYEARPEVTKMTRNWVVSASRESLSITWMLSDPELRGNISTKEVSVTLREAIGDIPDAEEVALDFQLGNRSPSLQFTINHDDLDVLAAAAEDFKRQLETYDTLYDVRDNMRDASQEIQMTLKPGAEKLGLNLGDVSRQVRQAYFGEEVQRLPRGYQDVRVYVRYPIEDRYSMESLKHFRVRTADGREVPLDSIVDMEYSPGISQIRHYDQKRSIVVTADMTANEQDPIMKDLRENFLDDWQKKYPEVTSSAIGNVQDQEETMGALERLYWFAAFSMYAMLAIGFKSYFQPILIMVSIPFAIVGAVIGHMFLGETFNLMSFFGIAAAAGVVVNDNLVLVDYCNRIRAKGLDAKTAIVEAGVARFRPILLTTMTTVVGLMPMMLETSIQAAFLQPIVVSLVFGVGLAFFVTLFMVPAMYAIGADLEGLGRRIKYRLTGKGKLSEQPAE